MLSTDGNIDPLCVCVPLNKFEPVVAKPYAVTCVELDTILDPFKICDEPDIRPSLSNFDLIVVLIEEVKLFKLPLLVSNAFNLP